MRVTLYDRILRAPDDGGGAQGGAAAAGDTAPGAAAAGADGSGAAAAAAAGAGAGAAAQPYRPDGLPDTMFGKDDRETIDKVHNAWKGYRDRDAARDVPAEAKDYLSLEGLKDFSLDETMKPHFEQLAADPAALAMFDRLKHHGVGRAAALDIWQTGMKAMSEAGLLEPPVDYAAERASLLPEAAKSLPKAQQDAAIEARLQANEDFVKLMTNQGLDKDVAEHGLLMLMDTAKGNQFLEFFRNQATGGGGAQPLAGQGGAGSGQNVREQLRARLAAPEMNPQHPQFNRAAWDALNEEYRKQFPG